MTSCSTRIACFNVMLLLLGIAVSIPLMIYVARPYELSTYFFTFCLTLLMIAPYVLLLLLNHFQNKTCGQGMGNFIVSLICVVGGVSSFCYAFFVDVQAQNGLLLVIIPVTQLVLVILLGLNNRCLAKRCQADQA